MWLRIYTGIVAFFLVIPILIVIPISFTSSRLFEFPPPDYSLQWFTNFLENEEWLDGLYRSFIVGIGTTLLSTILGTMAAIAIVKLKFPGKQLFMGLMIAPMVIPVIIMAIALYYTFSSLQLTNSLLGLTLAHTVLAIPIVLITVTSNLKGVDKNLELAAMGLGSTPLGAFFKITIPLIRPGILSGALLAFITSFDEVIVSLFVSGPTTKTLPLVMWERMRTNIDPTIAVVSTILIIGTTVIYFLYGWLSRLSPKSN